MPRKFKVKEEPKVEEPKIEEPVEAEEVIEEPVEEEPVEEEEAVEVEKPVEVVKKAPRRRAKKTEDTKVLDYKAQFESNVKAIIKAEKEQRKAEKKRIAEEKIAAEKKALENNKIAQLEAKIARMEARSKPGPKPGITVRRADAKKPGKPAKKKEPVVDVVAEEQKVYKNFFNLTGL